MLILVIITILSILFIAYHILLPLIIPMLIYLFFLKISFKFKLSTLMILNSYWSLSLITLLQLIIHFYTLKLNFLTKIWSINALSMFLIKLYL